MSSWMLAHSTFESLEEEFIRCQRFLQSKEHSLESLPWLRSLASALLEKKPSRAALAKQVLFVLMENEGDPQVVQFMDGMLSTIEAVSSLVHALEMKRTAEILEAEATLEFWDKSKLVTSIRETFIGNRKEQDGQRPTLALAA